MRKIIFVILYIVSCIGNVWAEKVRIGDLYYKLDASAQTAEVIEERYSGAITIPTSFIYEGKRYIVSSIGIHAFFQSQITIVTIPNSVTKIGDGAFSYCDNLTSIIVANDNPHYCSVNGALLDKQQTTFIKCPCGMKGSYIIPNGVTYIGNEAFSHCLGLTSIVIPNSVTSIAIGAFYGCKSLTSIIVAKDNLYYSSIDGVLFNKQRTTLIHCPTGKQGVYTIPNSVTSIEHYAFMDCLGLTSVFIPDGVTSIGHNAFYNVLNVVYFGPDTDSPWGARFINSHIEGNIVYSDETKRNLLACSTVTEGNIIIPDGVINIANEAFSGCSRVISIEIPNSVTSIGDMAFANCSSMENITIPNSVTHIGGGAFMFCNKLTSIIIPNSITSIEDLTFDHCIGLTSVTIPNNVTSIGGLAFENCIGLTNVTIPSSVTSIGEDAFWMVTNIVYNGTAKGAPWGARYVNGYTEGNYVYSDANKSTLVSCSLATQGDIMIPNNVTNIADSAFAFCSGLTTLAIPNSVTSIGDYAFSHCDSLFSVILAGNVQLGYSVFEDCPNVIVYTTNPTMSIPGVPAERVKKVTYQQLYDYPFSIFAKAFVEEEVNKWQQKGEYERISDWQKRVNEQTRQQKINELLTNAEQKYVEHWQPQTQLSLQLGKYDADNEVYALHDVQYGDIYMPVPIRDAKSFRENWEYKQFTYSLQIRDDQFKLASVSISMPNGKEYICHATDDVNYIIADIEYNFSPIDLNIASSNGSQGRQNISTKKIRAGISDVDMNIPETGAYNPNTFVVIFANEDYKNVASVPFAKNDGSVFQQYCQKTLGVPVNNIHYVENASFNDIRIQLAWLNDVCNAFDGNASLIVYYAGHGIPDETSKSAYLLPVDGDGRYVQSAYKLDDMYQKLGAMSAKSVIVFMDACFSGSKREEGMLASARGVAIRAKAGAPQGNMVVFSAATGDETAYPNNDEQHGMFTYYLLKKLQETKGDVTLQDLGNYIITNVRQQSIVKNGKSQTPTITPSAEASTWQTWKLK